MQVVLWSVKDVRLTDSLIYQVGIKHLQYLMVSGNHSVKGGDDMKNRLFGK